MNNNNYLLITICNHGFSEEIMEVAKAAGVKGGTIMRGRGSVTDKVEKFFGITIQPEKDIILIVLNNKIKQGVMDAIANYHGITKPAHAISFALPVEDVLGIIT